MPNKSRIAKHLWTKNVNTGKITVIKSATIEDECREEQRKSWLFFLRFCKLLTINQKKKRMGDEKKPR
jgi:hypothetical protein